MIFGADRPRRTTTAATIRSTPPAATISPPSVAAVLRGRVRQLRRARHARGPGLQGLRRGATRSCSPAAPRSAASSAPTSTRARPTMLFFAGGGGSVRGYAYRSIGVETIRARRRGPVRRRRRGPGRGLGRAALPHQRAAGARVGFVDAGLVTEDADLHRRRRLPHRRRPRRALLHRHRRRCAADLATPLNRAPTIRWSRSTSASGRRFETARGSPGRARARRHRRAGAGRRASPSDNGFLVNLLENRLSAPGPADPAAAASPARCRRGRGSRGSPSPTTRAPGSRSTTSSSTGAGSRCCAAGSTINRLSAERIAWLRRAEIAAAAAPAAAAPRRSPSRCRAAGLDPASRELALDSVSFAEPVFGQARGALASTGALNLDRAARSTATSTSAALDGPGGDARRSSAGFSNATRQLDIDLDLQEPEGGVVATLLRIEGTPGDRPHACRAPARSTRSTSTSPSTPTGDRIAQGVVALRVARRGPRLRRRLQRRAVAADPAAVTATSSPARARCRSQGVSKAAGGVRIDDAQRRRRGARPRRQPRDRRATASCAT